ncbi:MAG: hypothetical protein HFP78_05240 [Methylococcales symbiont of Hymedesmia sp. n. MRB-2018]|nr:MAG: hypothetical protein HFP78_05240 [Methylococcales symbiont of Hymedesmia sp. n. MRB-2018]
MSETKVDDMLIEMIDPKIKEIEQRFSDGKGLTQDDINTLLLKSQYNHINHLDEKLNEVTASVVDLGGKFDVLEAKFELLKTDIEGKFELLKTDIEITIQKALNRNMLVLISAMGFFLTLSKLIDKF